MTSNQKASHSGIEQFLNDSAAIETKNANDVFLAKLIEDRDHAKKLYAVQVARHLITNNGMEVYALATMQALDTVIKEYATHLAQGGN